MDKDFMMKWALAYAEKFNMAVFPLEYKGKRPIQKGGFKNATTDLETIKKWWTDHPFANIGCACGKASGGLVVIDLDTDDEKGIDGFHSLKDWERDNGSIPDTADVITGRGGYHMYYRSKVPVGSRIALLDGVDVRAEGGYTVLPPSIHPNGNQYEWEQSPDEFPIAEADEIIFSLLALGEPKESEQSKSFQMPTTIPMGSRNGTLYKLACSLQAKGLADDVIKSTVMQVNREQCEEPVDEDEVIKTIDSALSKNKGNLYIADEVSAIKPEEIKLDCKMGKNGPVVKQTINNNVLVLTQDENLSGRIRYNELAHAPYKCGKLPWSNPSDPFEMQWTDSDDSNLQNYLERCYGLSSEQKYLKAFDVVTARNRYNPIHDFLESLPEWDPKQDDDYIALLAPTFLGVEGNMLDYKIMKMFLLGAINRALRPGCKFDYILTLTGDQGVGKSSFVRGMAYNSEWCDDNFSSIDGARAQEKLMGRWILEIAELLALKKAREVEATKAFLTSSVDSYRPPYGRRVIQVPRMCVFVATTNAGEFLSDKTGGRRYLPLACSKARKLKSMNLADPWVEHFVKMTWAQAYHIFKADDPPIYFDEATERELEARRNDQYTEEDPRIGIIQEYLDNHPDTRVCAQSIWDHALHIGYPVVCTKADNSEIQSIMKNCIEGWVSIGRQRCGDYGRQQAYESIKHIKSLGSPYKINIK